MKGMGRRRRNREGEGGMKRKNEATSEDSCDFSPRCGSRGEERKKKNKNRNHLYETGMQGKRKMVLLGFGSPRKVSLKKFENGME
ncbi:hypothetical protein MRB53_028229 [Persea americana]|uniref:Uncharacterized protein n=1 Tax=Persea americana TaxID=3435 RepID=A0ACC2KEZ1_PERAE|nr:hypothetical protein MRB53_028229 [Persea americana]